MEVESKDLWFAKFKDDGTGEFQATFSSFGVVDKDFDVTLAGAFANGSQVIAISRAHQKPSASSRQVSFHAGGPAAGSCSAARVAATA